MSMHSLAMSMRRLTTSLPTDIPTLRTESNTIRKNIFVQGCKEEINRIFSSINYICLDFKLIFQQTWSTSISVLKNIKFIEYLWLLPFCWTSLCWVCLQMAFLTLFLFFLVFCFSVEVDIFNGIGMHFLGSHYLLLCSLGRIIFTNATICCFFSKSPTSCHDIAWLTYQ